MWRNVQREINTVQDQANKLTIEQISTSTTEKIEELIKTHDLTIKRVRNMSSGLAIVLQWILETLPIIKAYQNLYANDC